MRARVRCGTPPCQLRSHPHRVATRAPEDRAAGRRAGARRAAGCSRSSSSCARRRPQSPAPSPCALGWRGVPPRLSSHPPRWQRLAMRAGYERRCPQPELRFHRCTRTQRAKRSSLLQVQEHPPVLVCQQRCAATSAPYHRGHQSRAAARHRQQWKSVKGPSRGALECSNSPCLATRTRLARRPGARARSKLFLAVFVSALALFCRGS